MTKKELIKILEALPGNPVICVQTNDYNSHVNRIVPRWNTIITVDHNECDYVNGETGEEVFGEIISLNSGEVNF